MASTVLRPVLMMGSVRLAFPSADMDPEEVRELYAVNYPHLAHSSLDRPYADGGDLVYPVTKPPATTKG